MLRKSSNTSLSDGQDASCDLTVEDLVGRKFLVVGVGAGTQGQQVREQVARMLVRCRVESWQRVAARIKLIAREGHELGDTETLGGRGLARGGRLLMRLASTGGCS